MLFSWPRRRPHEGVVPDQHIPDVYEDFSETPEDALIAAESAPVHVVSADARLKIVDGVLVIERPGAPAQRRPIAQVASVHFHGGGLATHAVVSELVRLGRAVLWRSHSGYPVGWAAPMSQAGVEARRAQYRAAADAGRSTAIARALVAAKIRNMRGLLRRRNGQSALNANVLVKLDRLAATAAHQTRKDELLGVEGAATRLYFEAFPSLLKNHASETEFPGRRRRPAGDLVNCVLSYMYSVLSGECICALIAAGLDPREGLFHSTRAGRPSLALDLMEPFRPAVADAAATAALNAGAFAGIDLQADGQHGRLGETGRKAALAALENRLQTSARPSGRATSAAWRDLIAADALSLADTLRFGAAFQPTVYA